MRLAELCWKSTVPEKKICPKVTLQTVWDAATSSGLDGASGEMDRGVSKTELKE